MTKNILIISILLFILSSILFGRVPIDENKIRITSTFGEFRTDHFHNGVDFGGSKMEIYPMADGEIVHYFDIAEDPTTSLATAITTSQPLSSQVCGLWQEPA